MHPARLVVAVASALFAAGCAGGAAPVTAPPTGAVLQAAAEQPSVSAVMVCAAQAQNDVAEALGEKAVRVDAPTWVGHRYSCRYQYPGGSFLMAVKELSSAAETDSYFEGLATQLGDTQRLDGLGQGAFLTTNGSAVIRKDFKVLLVDDSALPPQLSHPPLTPGNVALLVAKTILGCWNGA